MTTTRESLDRFAEGNKNRGDFLTKLFDMVVTVATVVEDSDITVLAAQAGAEIALWDSENEQKEIANLIAVANSENFDMPVRQEAARRVNIMLGLNE